MIKYFETCLTDEEKEEYKRQEEGYNKIQNIVDKDMKRKILSDQISPMEITVATMLQDDAQGACYHKFKGTIGSEGEQMIQNVLKDKGSIKTSDFSKKLDSVEVVQSCDIPTNTDDNERYITEFSEPAHTGTSSYSDRGYITLPEMISMK